MNCFHKVQSGFFKKNYPPRANKTKGREERVVCQYFSTFHGKFVTPTILLTSPIMPMQITNTHSHQNRFLTWNTVTSAAKNESQKNSTHTQTLDSFFSYMKPSNSNKFPSQRSGYKCHSRFLLFYLVHFVRKICRHNPSWINENKGGRCAIS